MTTPTPDALESAPRDSVIAHLADRVHELAALVSRLVERVAHLESLDRRVNYALVVSIALVFVALTWIGIELHGLAHILSSK